MGFVFGHVLDNFGGNFGDPFWDQIDQSFKVPKTCICKNLKKPIGMFKVFGFQGRPRQPRKAQGGPQEAPEELQNLKKQGSKNGPNFYNLLDQFRGPFWGKNRFKIGTKKRTSVGTRFPRHSEVAPKPKRKIDVGGEKENLLEIYSAKERQGSRKPFRDRS